MAPGVFGAFPATPDTTVLAVIDMTRRTQPDTVIPPFHGHNRTAYVYSVVSGVV